MEHILIVTGGYLDLVFAKEYCKTLSYDKVFAVDRGLEYVDRLGISPDYIVGDFDTVAPDLLAEYESRIQKGEIGSLLERYPVKKDATDTELALHKAMEDGAGQITLLGATGSRMDHVLANIGLLLQTAGKGIPCFLVDATNRIRLLSKQGQKMCTIRQAEQFGRYLSILPLSEIVKGVTMEGVLYPLKDYDILQGSSLTVSNEIVGAASISLEDGALLVIESRD